MCLKTNYRESTCRRTFSLIKNDGDRRQQGTVVVLIINHADWRVGVVCFVTPLAPSEKSMFVGSGESMVARLKLKGNDGRAPPGGASVALFDTTRGKTHQVQRQ